MAKLISWIVAIVVLLIVIFVAGVVIIAVVFPGSLGLMASSISASFSSASSNSTFHTSSVNFSYPANWVAINQQLLSSTVSKILPLLSNGTVNGTLGSVGVIFPSSLITSIIGFLPTLISHANGNLSGLKPPRGVSFIVAGGTKISNSSLNLSKILSEASNNSVLQTVTLSGEPGFSVSISNSSMAGSGLALGRLDISEVNGSVCFVFGASVDNSTSATLNKAFGRVSGSINCSFSTLGASLASGLLSNILPNMTG